MTLRFPLLTAKRLWPLAVVLMAISLIAGHTAQAAASESRGDERVTPRIVGGDPAAPGSWPSIAAVFPGPYMCGGTLIDSRWILTAAHCVVIEGIDSPDDVDALLGSNSIIPPYSSGYEIKEATAIQVHPDYDPSLGTSGGNDLALIKLNSASAKPVMRMAKPSESADFSTGDTAKVAGWGRTCFAVCDGSADLLEVEVFIDDRGDCVEAYGSLPANTICASDTGKDSCQGDSGGPLTVETASGRSQVGIVSFGNGCAEPGYPGVYADATAYRAWIGRYVVSSTNGPSNYSFGKVKKRRTKTTKVAFTNPKTLPTTITGRSITGSSRFKIASSTCGASLEGNASCTVTVSFRPTRTRSYSASLSLKGSFGTLKSVALRGRGKK